MEVDAQLSLLFFYISCPWASEGPAMSASPGAS